METRLNPENLQKQEKSRQYARNEQNYWTYVTGFVLQYNNHGSGAFHVIVASCISKGLS